MTRRGAVRSESGFTLVELTIALFIGTIVMMATFNIFDSGQRSAITHQERSDATQRGRTAMEQITQELHSQVCFGTQKPAIISGDDNSVTFYADMSSSTTFVPQKRQLAFDAQGRVWEYVWNGTGTAPNTTYNTAPNRKRIIIDHVQHIKDAGGNQVPYLQYYAFTGTSPVTPTLALVTPLSAADAGHTVQIGVNFGSMPVDNNTRVNPVPFQSVTYVRTADPNDPTHSPECF